MEFPKDDPMKPPRGFYLSEEADYIFGQFFSMDK